MRLSVGPRCLLVAFALIGLDACKGPGASPVVPGPTFQAAAPSLQTMVEPDVKRAPVVLSPGAVIGTDNLFSPKSGDARDGGRGGDVAGIPCRKTEYVNAYHVHFYVGIIDERRQVALPDAIGLVGPGRASNGFISSAKCFYYIHTHDASGTVHIEVPRNLPPSAVEYTLGQFLNIWGVPYGRHEFGPFKGDVQVFIGTVALKQVTVSAYRRYTRSLSTIPLRSHEAIWIVIGKKPMRTAALPPVTFYMEY